MRNEPPHGVRTTALAGGFGLLLLGGAAFGPRQAGETARGVVFEDRDGDGQRGVDEPGIAGVRVSDGEEVTVTDEEGRWSLSVGDEAVLFITKPSGYAVSLSADNLPRFYYVHQPAGSPAGLRYPGVEPTGPLPASIDFPLVRRDEPAAFDVLLFADPQPQTEAELDYIREDVLDELIDSGAAFGMTLGDILFDDLSLFPRYVALVGGLGIPWYNVPGNHELNFEADGDRHSLETFKRYFGPPYYSFEHGEAVFLVLDNIEYQGGGASDPGDVRGNGGYVARIGERQLAWLERELSHVPAEKLVVLAMHAPLASYVSPHSTGVNTQDRDELFRILAGRPNLYSMAGHTHTTEHVYFGEEDGFPGPGELHHHVLTTVSGSWWSGPFDERGVPTSLQRDGTPNGYHVLHIDGAEVKASFRAAGQPADHQMRIVLDVAHHGLGRDGLRDFRWGELFDGRLSVDAVPAAELLVNLFDGGPRSRVALRIGDREPLPMRRVKRRDPYAIEVFVRNEDTKKSWVNAEPSSHLFAVDLPDDLAPGVHVARVLAIDEFGREHRASALIEVTGR
ncbi:MAG: calcineurin-like phosphoesterase family protein [Planctomycetota bacterium]